MNDPKITSAIIAFAASIIVAIIQYIVLLRKWKREIKIAENKIFEEITTSFVKERIEPYTDFMKSLFIISSQNIEGYNKQEISEKVGQLKDIIQNAIYGKIGLIASHETRESILILRSQCIKFIKNKIDYEELKMSSWKVHQMLRSDLGLAQPGLSSAIEKSRTKELAGKEPEILALLKKIHHNKW